MVCVLSGSTLLHLITTQARLFPEMVATLPPPPFDLLHFTRFVSGYQYFISLLYTTGFDSRVSGYHLPCLYILNGTLTRSNMVTNEIRKERCLDVLRNFMANNRGTCVFFTLTTPDVVDFLEIRRRWRNLRHWLCRYLGDVKFVMNFEVHPGGHGWHIHSVWDTYIPLTSGYVMRKIRSFGFGRVDVRKVNSHGVAEYLTKHALKAYCKRVKLEGCSGRVRLVNASRGLPVLSDYKYQSSFDTSRKHSFNYLNHLCLDFPVKKSISDISSSFGLSVLESISLYFNLNNSFSNLQIHLQK